LRHRRTFGNHRVVILLLLLLLQLPRAGNAAKRETAPGILVRREGACRLVLPEANQAIQRRLRSICSDGVQTIYRQLGAPPPAMPPHAPEIEVRIVARPADFSRHSPQGVVLPDWTGAVAFPKHGRILLPLFHADGRPHTDTEVTLLHELSHLAFYKVAGDIRAPRWFTEGIAILQSEGSSLQRRSALWWASLLNRIQSLEAIERYPRSDLRARQAYAQGAEFVAFLLQAKGWEGIRQVLSSLESDGFEAAFRRVYGASIPAMEARWQRQLFGSTDWMMTVTSDAVFLGAAALFCLLAFWIIRRRYHRQLVHMEQEEESIRQLIAAVEEEAADRSDADETDSASRTVLH
jgi:hypothetical protein